MFKKPDISAPRFRKDSKDVINIAMFKRFKEKYPEHNITYEQFRNVIINHSGKMWMEVVTSRDGIILPESIGHIFLGSTKIVKKKNVNIQASIKANRQVLHRNWSTDGHVGKIYFTSHLIKGSYENGRGLWSFRGHRNFKRTVSREYPKNWQNYVVILGRRKASQTYKRHQARQIMEGRTEKAMSTYNEFDLN